MGAICCFPSEESAKPFEKGGDNDLTAGPRAQRGCTDPLCLLIYLAHIGLFVVVTMAGFSDGNPRKLFLPRDYAGSYCGVSEQWNNGPDLKAQEKVWYTMNVSSTVADVAKAAVCTDAVENFLSSSGSYGTAALLDYQCTCCKVPCNRCPGSLTGRAAIPPGANMATIITNRMKELTEAQNMNLFSSNGANGDLFTNIWDQATRYFVKVCSTTCSTEGTPRERSYVYKPDQDDPLFLVWEFLLTDASTPAEIKTVLQDQFTFMAYDESICPYEASKCVPFPGIEFSELAGGYCQFKIAADVVNAIGGTAADAFAGLGLNKFASGATETFGSWIGEIEAALDTVITVAFLAFIVGLTFCILVRFFLGIVIWLAILILWCLLLLSGGMIFVRSGQCKGASFFDSGKQTLEAAKSLGQDTASNLAAGQTEVTIESISGNGADYRGFQMKTKSGLICMNWKDANDPTINEGNLDFPALGLESNYCRNPIDPKIPYESATIWCYTTEPSVKWETCLPVGVLQPACQEGYEVESEMMRDALVYFSYALWIAAGIYLIAIWCLFSRIRLAINVNKAAALFIYETPSILLLPIISSFIAIVWMLCWALSATFLVSQVPQTYTPTGAYATYAEAYGTDTVPGKCNDKWPTGSVYRDADNCETDADGTLKCWRCFPPRYILDPRFAYSFFSFLWNNAFLISCGQCIIAGAVGIWFFKPQGQKRMSAKVITATKNVFRYHAGSLAFGSFLLAVVQFLRYFMMYMEKQAQAQKNQVMVIVLKVMQCCMWCLEKCLKFLNSQAYIQVALMGTNFCTSARAAFSLILRNFLRFGVVMSVGWVVEWVGYCFITLVTALVGYLLLKQMHPEAAPVMPVIVFVAIGYIVGRLFMALFNMAVNTCLQCFVITEEMGGEPAGEPFVPGPLRGIIGACAPPPKEKKEDAAEG
eukprot:TRINITY_DN10446_c0_g1_i3.p1 TRINITY_DN10446_c0_g1~~TRINITY_DN10446_c0_g1_i3.p1  ORF type:complete len:932 (+),score=213.90 TRINITY_DN10446_c0_g1_i3:88-2883(+)